MPVCFLCVFSDSTLPVPKGWTWSLPLIKSSSNLGANWCLQTQIISSVVSCQAAHFFSSSSRSYLNGLQMQYTKEECSIINTFFIKFSWWRTTYVPESSSALHCGVISIMLQCSLPVKAFSGSVGKATIIPCTETFQAASELQRREESE